MTIGIVGHRDIPDDHDVPDGGVAAVSEQVIAVVSHYRRTYPNTPVLLLTSLAEGADQIAARACAGLGDKNVAIVAVLPMPQQEYERDFTEPGALDSFRGLLDAAAAVVIGDRLDLADGDAPVTVEGAPDRAAAYQSCARFISRQSHVLIALWDGQRGEAKPGGSADTVNYRLSSGVGMSAIDDQPQLWPKERGILIHVPSRRRRHRDAPRSVTGQEVSAPQLVHDVEDHEPWTGQADEIARRIDEANIRIARETAPTSLTRSVKGFASRSASAAQVRFRSCSAWVLVTAVAGLAVVDLELNFRSGWLAGAAVASFALSVGIWFGMGRRRIKSRFQQSRALAEGARVQQMWLESSINLCAADFYLVNQPDVAWIRRLLRSAWLVDRIAAAGAPARAPSLEPARTWMTAQRDYFAGSAKSRGAIKRSARGARRYARLTRLGVVVALVGISSDLLNFWPRLDAPEWVLLAGQSLWGLGLGTAAASTAYGQLMAFRESGRQYAISLEHFDVGLRLLDDALAGEDPVRRGSVIVNGVAIHALGETSSWFALNYDRSVRPI